MPVVTTALVFTGGVLTGQTLSAPQPAREVAAAPPVETVTVTPTPTPTATDPTTAPSDPIAAPEPTAPVKLVVPSLAVKAPVVDIDLSSDAVLEPPVDPSLVGWWTGLSLIHI